MRLPILEFATTFLALPLASDADLAARFDPDGDGFAALQYGGDDCDDADAEVNPDAEERCDDANVEEDCDGAAAAADESATGKGS